MTGYRLCPLPLGNALADLVGRYGVVEVGDALRGLYPHAWPLPPEPTPDLATLTANVDLNATSVDRLAARVDALAARLDAIDARLCAYFGAIALAEARSLYGPTICGAFRPTPDGFTWSHGYDNWPCVVGAGHEAGHIDAGGDGWPRAKTETPTQEQTP